MLSITSTLSWPTEGRVALDPSHPYIYCNESFAPQGSGKVKDANGEKIDFTVLQSSSISAKKDDDIVYVSIGAMGPDDPAIERNITLSVPNESPISYKIMIAPRSAIIDDVILTDSYGSNWMIMDRNIQNISPGSERVNYIGRDASGKKWQAYNYCGSNEYSIPFKFKSEGMPFSETMHELYKGLEISYNYRNNAKTGFPVKRPEWLGKYKHSEADGLSPQFYDEYNYDSWIFPTRGLLEVCSRKMKMSKMRMFLLSELPAIEDGKEIPICCYWPYEYSGEAPEENDSFRWGYFITEEGYSQITPRSLMFIFYDGEKIRPFDWNVKSDDIGFSRLVRPLTDEELQDYKTNYLGYGSQPHRLTICHPDTYESTPFGWIKF